MVSTPTPPSLAIADPDHLGSSARSMLVHPFSRVELEPPPSDTNSGLFPAVEARPTPDRRALRLRRAVLMTVVLGAAALLGYASWQRASQDRSHDSAARPVD